MRLLMRLVSFAILLAPLAIGSSCAPPSPPPVTCPQPPTQWVIRGHPLTPANFPPVIGTQRAHQTSIDLDLSRFYMRDRIKAELNTPLPRTGSPTPSSGITVQDVRLKDQDVGTWPLNLVLIDFRVWVNSQGTPVEINGTFQLQLMITPYRITPYTVPDKQKRLAFLGSTDTGVALRFDFFKLINNQGKEATCPLSQYDYLDEQLLTHIYTALSTQTPLVIPSAQLTSIADLLLSTPTTKVTTNLVGINVSSDQNLQIGFQLDQGGTHLFDPYNTLILHGSVYDWGVNIDKSLLNASITQQAWLEVIKKRGGFFSSIDTMQILYLPSEIHIALIGSSYNPVCGTIHWTADVFVNPLIRKLPDPDGRSILVTPRSEASVIYFDNFAQELCVGALIPVDDYWKDLLEKLAPPSSGPISNKGECASQMGDPISFQVDKDLNDTFYATGVTTYWDSLFIYGTSTFEDQLVGQRSPPVTPCP